MASFQREVKFRLDFMERHVSRWTGPGGILALLILWQLVCMTGFVSELYLPAPTSILKTGWSMAESGEIAVNLQASLQRIAWGFVIGSIAGILIGLMTGFSRLAEAVGNPLIHSLYPIPKIALLPLIILWLGIGEVSKVSIIALGVFFPVVINTYSGVKNVDPLLLRVAVSYRTSRLNMIRKVVLPAALPVIFAGLKLAAGTSLLLLVAAEMIAAKEGVGAMILHYGDLMLTTKLMVGVLVLSLLGLVFNRCLEWLEQKLIPWK